MASGDPHQDLLDAIDDGNAAEIDRLLAAGVHPVPDDYSQTTALARAIKAKNAALVDRFLALVKPKQWNLIFEAIHGDHRNLALIERIIVMGANVDQLDEWCKFPLFYAVQKNNPELVRLLIARGADRTLTYKGKTLEQLAEHKKPEVRALVRKRGRAAKKPPARRITKDAAYMKTRRIVARIYGAYDEDEDGVSRMVDATDIINDLPHFVFGDFLHEVATRFAIDRDTFAELSPLTIEAIVAKVTQLTAVRATKRSAPQKRSKRT